MTPTRRLPIAVLTALIVAGMAAPSAAAPITLTATDGGWYNALGFHDPTNPNYIAGQNSLLEFRDFFTFNLSSLAGMTVTSATLALTNPSSGYSSNSATETYTLFDVSTSAATLVAGGIFQFNTFNDLGSGTSFGSRTVSSADNNTIVLTSFNAAGLNALNAGIGGAFAVGGAVTSLSGLSDQFIFGFTGSGNVRELRLNVEPVIPEPATLVLLGSGLLFGAAGARMRRRRNR